MMVVESAYSQKAPDNLVFVKGGTFKNVNSTNYYGKSVFLSSFYIGKYEVTQKEWMKVMASNPSQFKGDLLPVEMATWYECVEYCNKRSLKEGLKPYYQIDKNKKDPNNENENDDLKWTVTINAGANGYRLPTEAEWEYAARGGTQTRYWWGDELQAGMANCKNCMNVATVEQPIKIGSFKPNPFGLYDMGGTVDQWVEDCWHKNYQGAPSDGSAWVEPDCSSHVIRSGSWKNDARYVRPANRDSYDTNVRYPTHGFRIALSP